MPRIRSLKPEHKTHRKIGPLTDRQYRLWIGMLTEADDEGRLVADPEQLRTLVFAYHPRVHSRDVQSALEALAAVGLIRLYLTRDTQYADFPSWQDHQRVSPPAPTKLPSYNDSLKAPEDSGGLAKPPEDSVLARARGSDRKGSDRKGSDLIGREGRELASGGRVTPEDSENSPAWEVLEWLNTKAGKSYRPVSANLDLIRARIRDGLEPWQLKAVVSRKVREWGPDPKMSKFLRPETLFGKTKCEQYVGELPPLERNGDDPHA